MTNREKIFEDFGINLESDCICTSEECEEECIKNGDCFRCNKWLNAEFKEKIGHWIFVKRYKYPSMCGDWICSRCKTTTAECVRKDNKWAIPTYKYCPLCGIKMEVKE